MKYLVCTLTDDSMNSIDSLLLALGIQATTVVMNSSDPLKALKQLSQNFPKYMLPLARRVNVTDELENEVMLNAGLVQVGVNVMWLNGQVLQDTEINPFG